jgi:mercuric ion transport protein
MTNSGREASHRRRGHVYAVLALVTCPCHLPILAVLLSGSAAGVFLNDHFAMAVMIFSLLFVCSLVAAMRVLRVKQAHDI